MTYPTSKLRYSPVMTSPRTARHAVCAVLARWHLAGDVISDAALITSELVTNALEHGSGPVTLTLRKLPGRVYIAVSDTAPIWAMNTTETHEFSEYGRGLPIISELSIAFGLEARKRTAGKTFWVLIAGS